MYVCLKEGLMRQAKIILEECNYTEGKKENILKCFELYLDGDEINEIAAKLDKNNNTIKGYLSNINSNLFNEAITLLKEIHILNRFNCKDNLYAFIKDCYEKGLPISDIPNLLGRYYPDARMFYQQLEKTESKGIRDKCLKLKGIPSNFEDIAFFYIMGRNKLSFVKMFNITASHMNKIKKYLDTLNQEPLNNAYERVDRFSSNSTFKNWLKVMELYIIGNSPKEIKSKTNLLLPEIKNYIKIYESKRIFEALPRVNVVLTYLGDFDGQDEFEMPANMYDTKHSLD